MANKKFYAQSVLNELSNDILNRDFHIDEREVFFQLDRIVNELGRKSYFENWQLSGALLDESFITTWDEDNAIRVVDEEDQYSYLELPADPMDLPRGAGIQEIFPMERGEYNQSVVIVSHADVRLYQNQKAGNMQAKLWGYRKGNRFYFGEDNVGGKFGEYFGVRLAIRDSSFISLTANYPIPADKQHAVVSLCVQWFRNRLGIGSDKVRDGNLVNTP